MRSEREILNLIVAFARENTTVRAVVQNGSRVNPRVTPDEFADYDVVFVVENPEDFKGDRSWMRGFGETLIVQQNDSDEPGVNWVIFLMLFSDGVRIDLKFFPTSRSQLLYKDSLKKLLLDKDGLFDNFTAPDDSSYFVKKPSEDQFYRTVDNFWWCLTNVAGGIARGELCYVKTMHETVVRPEMNRLLAWHIGLRRDWKVDPGHFGRWFHKHLPPDVWSAVERSYAGSDYGDIWRSVFESGKLVRRIGLELAGKLGYRYPIDEDENVTGYVSDMKKRSGEEKQQD
ncbi:MAG: aminoglycoside 6-adenylyltransferase [Spirochaetales bacterium]|nr:aminoglycoside 6-adenylyltransferase [Spirochaetales bacterium]